MWLLIPPGRDPITVRRLQPSAAILDGHEQRSRAAAAWRSQTSPGVSRQRCWELRHSRSEILGASRDKDKIVVAQCARDAEPSLARTAILGRKCFKPEQFGRAIGSAGDELLTGDLPAWAIGHKRGN